MTKINFEAHSPMARYFYPSTVKTAAMWRREQASGPGQKYGNITGAVIADTLRIIPKIVMGTRIMWPKDALATGSLTLPQRGIVGTTLFTVGKLAQFLGAGAGAVVGGVACLAATVFGCGGSDWIDRAAGKGWQIGTFVGLAILGVSELSRCAWTGLSSCLGSVICATGGSVGSLVDQAIDLFATMPRYSSVV